MTTDQDRTNYVLAALSTAGGAPFTPVQVQKLFFLLEDGAKKVGAPRHFDFEPYDYGPFDVSVYRVLDSLAVEGKVVVDHTGPVRTYRLTQAGHAEAQWHFERLDARMKDYVQRCSEFVRRLSFTELVSAIYKAYPEMKANSVFRDA